MKKLFLFLAITSVVFAFSSCGKYCVCTVSKNGSTLEQIDYSDQELSSDECFNKVDETWDQLGRIYTPESLVGVSVTCDHL